MVLGATAKLQRGVEVAEVIAFFLPLHPQAVGVVGMEQAQVIRHKVVYRGVQAVEAVAVQETLQVAVLVILHLLVLHKVATVDLTVPVNPEV